jgi:hypothetical protein
VGDRFFAIRPLRVSAALAADPLGTNWLSQREDAARVLSSTCERVAELARDLGLDGLGDLLSSEARALRSEASVCRGERIRLGVTHPPNQGACDPEENCCQDCAVEYSAPEEDRC